MAVRKVCSFDLMQGVFICPTDKKLPLEFRPFFACHITCPLTRRLVFEKDRKNAVMRTSDTKSWYGFRVTLCRTTFDFAYQFEQPQSCLGHPLEWEDRWPILPMQPLLFVAWNKQSRWDSCESSAVNSDWLRPPRSSRNNVLHCSYCCENEPKDSIRCWIGEETEHGVGCENAYWRWFRP
jgi:hypothetical protein